MFRSAHKNEGSLWFRRLLKDLKKISRHIRVKRIRNGFFRIYWKDAYIYEVYKEMPARGYGIETVDPRFESKKFWEEKEDRADLTRQLKNFVEGYYDALDHIKTSVYQMRHNKEHYELTRKGYSQTVIK